MKRWPMSSFRWQQGNTNQRNHGKPTRMAIIEKTDNSKLLVEMWRNQNFIHTGGTIKWCRYLRWHKTEKKKNSSNPLLQSIHYSKTASSDTRRMILNSSRNPFTLLIYSHKIRCKSELLCLTPQREEDTGKFRPQKVVLEAGTRGRMWEGTGHLIFPCEGRRDVYSTFSDR